MGEYPSNEGVNEGVNGAVKDITNIIKKVSANSTGEESLGGITSVGGTTEYGNINSGNGTAENSNLGNESKTGYNGKISGYNKKNEWKTSNISKDIDIENEGNTTNGSSFKVATTNLPAKVGFWTKVRNVLFCEIKVELTPYQQKVEDEINEFLHQEITWKSFKNFLFQEVPITYKGKRIF